VVVYGDNNNWFAAYGFWLMKYYGHKDVRLMNGGRSKWLNEQDKPFTNEKPSPAKATYKILQTQPALRARIAEVLQNVNGNSTGKDCTFVDVRSPDEFTGKVIAPPGMSETAQRAGHIPGAKSVPWSKAVNQDGTFKGAQELKDLYQKEAGVTESKPTITYCRIGERSSHTWFVLKYLVGIPEVKNYDGSWTEYGNLVGVPIEKNV
jgi:thiosulfate/3-mercaptopyruvate sulfurtransferase